jgi:hypothetical protein
MDDRVRSHLEASFAAVSSEIDRYVSKLDDMGWNRRHRAVRQVESYLEAARKHQVGLQRALG